MNDSRAVLTRRNLLIASGGAVAVLGAGVAPAFAATNPGSEPRGRDRVGTSPLASAGHDQWAAEVGSTFGIAGAQGLALTEVRPLDSSGPRPAGGRDRAFVAKFDVVGGRIAGDGIHTVSHPRHGPFQIFLTGAGDGGLGRVHAVFN